MDFTKSDKSLEFMRKLFTAVAWIMAILFMIIGIVCWANSSYQKGYYGTKQTDGTMVGMGFVYFIGGPLLCLLTYHISMFTIWIAYDIKVIRNAVTKTKNSKIIEDFAVDPKPTPTPANNDQTGNAQYEEVLKRLAELESKNKKDENK